MLFNYRARNQQGAEVKGQVEAADKFDLASTLRDQGLVVVEVTVTTPGSVHNWSGQLNFLTGRVKMRDKILLASNLAAMIEAGLTLTRALSVVERETASPRLKTVVQTITEHINQGESFSKSLNNFPEVFPPLFISMVAAGEEAGKLPEALKLIADQMQKSYDLRRKIKGAMIYPIIVLGLIVAVGALMMIFVVPTLVTTFKDLNVELPLSTRLVMGLSDLLAYHYLLVVLVLLILIVSGIFWFRTPKGKKSWAWVVLHLPIVKTIAKKANAALLLRTLGALLSSGVSMIESIKITGRVLQNPYYQVTITEAAKVVEQGGTLSQVFIAAPELYPVLVGEMMAVGEETGKLSDMLFRGAIFFEEEVDQATKNLSTLIEPVLMVLIGAAVGFFAISMISPIYSLSNAF